MPDARPNFVSCLCVTEDREAFMPWLLWGFRRQTWTDRELVIVSGSDVPASVREAEGVRIVSVARGMSVPAKRNVALEHARGDIVAWFDDDDWQHPDRLTRIVAALDGGANVAGVAAGWFVDLHGERCCKYRGGNRVVFNGAGFRTEVARAVQFDIRKRRASDTGWLRTISNGQRRATSVLPGDDAFFWLCHASNISNPASRRRFTAPIESLRSHLGEAWGDTDAQLQRLREEIGVPPEATVVARAPRRERVLQRRVAKPATARSRRAPAVAAPRRAERSDSRAETGGELPPVAAVVKVCALDVPFAAVTIPHLLRQTGRSLHERILVVDRGGDHRGKYRVRSTGSIAGLDELCRSLVEANHIDRVVEVDDDPARQQEILSRYFVDAKRVPKYASTGGPIYATLLGLESASVDHVVQFDCDMLFHASGPSWIDAALRVLLKDSSAWLAMTHGGPPAGECGSAAGLGGANARRAVWDAAHEVWRFATASTRYFLTDRRRLRGRLRPLPRSGGCAPLELCIAEALERHRASRVCVEIPGSWDLHPYSHEPPFPEWVAKIAQAVERGDVPPLQRGGYDLRLDRPRDRAAWARLLGDEKPSAPPAQAGRHPRRSARPVATRRAAPRAPAATRSLPEVAPAPTRDRAAPLAVVVPVRDRAGERVRHCLASLNWQTGGAPWQTLVVSHGSRPEIDDELAQLCADARATLIRVGDPRQPWCKPHALNVGLQATDPAMAFVMPLDVDMILAPNFVETVLATLRANPQRMVLCRSSDLPRQAKFPSGPLPPRAFPGLHRGSRLRGRHGCGGVQAAPRSFFFDVRGYDEDFTWWGHEDRDMLQRATLAGLEPVWIESNTAMLHQWHPKRHSSPAEAHLREQVAAAIRRNRELLDERATLVVRNPKAWGSLGLPGTTAR
jgi:glycosyltransferase involved in cell wall biosynthesis